MAAARDVVHALADAGLTVATGESLTADLLAARLADVPGASAVLHGGVVAYQNAVKTGLLGVPEDLLARVGAVDADVARRMALGARAALGADVGVATTGVAGPEPHQGQPVGTVWLGLAVPDADANALDVLGGERDGAATAILLRLDGDRAAIREATVAAALQALTRLLAGRGADLCRKLGHGERLVTAELIDPAGLVVGQQQAQRSLGPATGRGRRRRGRGRVG